jgi:hypothetical protein
MYEQEQSFTRKKDRIYRELRAWAVDPDRTNVGLTKI